MLLVHVVAALNYSIVRKTRHCATTIVPRQHVLSGRRGSALGAGYPGAGTTGLSDAPFAPRCLVGLLFVRGALRENPYML